MTHDEDLHAATRRLREAVAAWQERHELHAGGSTPTVSSPAGRAVGERMTAVDLDALERLRAKADLSLVFDWPEYFEDQYLFALHHAVPELIRLARIGLAAEHLDADRFAELLAIRDAVRALGRARRNTDREGDNYREQAAYRAVDAIADKIAAEGGGDT